MTPKATIERKRFGEELSAAEIQSFIDGYMDGTVADCQASAFAMATCCNGMTDAETSALTDALIRSGRTLEWEAGAPTADKHSTGGVGDKLSFIVQPVAAACGLRVPSLVGRSLGFTGGTADKLESIPGFTASLTLERFKETVNETGLSMATQTDEITPADRKLYALRDVTGTVASKALITASILSKKLAEGARTLVFDVRCGLGAFMKTREEARSLAEALVNGAAAAGRKAAAIITSMDAPAGFAVGNADEVQEALCILRNESAGAPEVRGTALELAAMMVALAKDMPQDEARAMCEEKLADGSALAKFEAIVAAQGGNLAAFDAMMRRPRPKFVLQSTRAGYIAGIDAGKTAEASLALGAGRTSPGDAIDPLAGIILSVAPGSKTSPGAPLATLAKSGSPDGLEQAAAILQQAFSFAREPVAPQPAIIDTVFPK